MPGSTPSRRRSNDSWLPDITNGNFDTMVFVHCGSLSEPVETLKDYHSKYSKPPRDRDPLHGGRFALFQPGL